MVSVYFIGKIHLYVSIGDGQPREPALRQLYRYTVVLCLRSCLCCVYTQKSVPRLMLEVTFCTSPFFETNLDTVLNIGLSLESMCKIWFAKIQPLRLCTCVKKNAIWCGWGCIKGNRPTFSFFYRSCRSQSGNDFKTQWLRRRAFATVGVLGDLRDKLS